MKNILKAKVEKVPRVKDELLATGNKLIAEAVPNNHFLSAGLTKEVLCKTDPTKFPSKNTLDKMWMEIGEEHKQDSMMLTGDSGEDEHKDEKDERKRKLSQQQNTKPVSKSRPNGTTPHKSKTNAKKK